MTDEIVYSASEVYKRLGISDSTLRKYMEVLLREGFAVKKDNRGRRQYTEHDGMTLEKAAKMIAQRIEMANPETEESQETDLIPFHTQQQLQQQYSVMVQEINQSILMMEKRLEARDETLMKTLREMQETKRLMQEFLDEVASGKGF
ncbi:hypothetical protein CON30_23145 [Bacillus cereus]|nr:hypothetical protein CON30_23145 [Bacillus cereus]